MFHIQISLIGTQAHSSNRLLGVTDLFTNHEDSEGEYWITSRPERIGDPCMTQCRDMRRRDRESGGCVLVAGDLDRKAPN